MVKFCYDDVIAWLIAHIPCSNNTSAKSFGQTTDVVLNSFDYDTETRSVLAVMRMDVVNLKLTIHDLLTMFNESILLTLTIN